tara:strand:- start:2524 stop:2736 length:213 start_codon:yes stop_codon:yes gene_type:complete
MGLVAGVLAPLVAGTGALVLVLRPLLVTALYSGQFPIVGRNTALAPIGPVALALAMGFLFVNRTKGTYLP